MDLIQMGYTIRDVGARLRWSDIRVIVKHLPDDSHLKRQRAPDKNPIRTNTEQLLAMVYDAVKTLPYTLAGHPENAPPSLMQQLDGGATAGVEKPEKKRRKAPQLAASEVRARVAASMK